MERNSEKWEVAASSLSAKQEVVSTNAVTAGISLTKEDSSAVQWWERGGGAVLG